MDGVFFRWPVLFRDRRVAVASVDACETAHASVKIGPQAIVIDWGFVAITFVASPMELAQGVRNSGATGRIRHMGHTKKAARVGGSMEEGGWGKLWREDGDTL